MRLRLAALTLAGTACLALPAQAQQAACPALTRAFQLELQPLSDGMRYSMPIMVNGKEKQFLVATGIFNSNISTSAVAEMNLKTKPLGTRLSSNGKTVGQVSMTQADLQIGPIKAPAHEMWVTQLGSVDGVIGADLMQNYDIEMDFAGRKISYFLTDHCPGRVVHWATSGITSVNFMGWENHSNVVGTLQVKVQINGREVNAELDTGRSQSVLDADTARALFEVTADSTGAVPMGALDNNPLHRVYGYTFQTLKIGGLTLRDPKMQVYPDLFGKKDRDMLRADSHVRTVLEYNEPVMYIGMDVLSRLHLYLAAKEKKIYFTGATGQAVTTSQPGAAQKPAN